MFRFATVVGLLLLHLTSVGCRMCHVPFDNCIPATIDRSHDLRSCGEMHRAGSAFEGCCGTNCINAGNYGSGKPVPPLVHDNENRGHGTDYNGTPLRIEGIDTPIPPGQFLEGFNIEFPRLEDPINQLPTNQQRQTSPTVPMLPPASLENVPSPFNGNEIKSIPFSDNDEAFPLLPPVILPETSDDLPITLEELRRIDPSVMEIQIISIEDAGATK